MSRRPKLRQTGGGLSELRNINPVTMATAVSHTQAEKVSARRIKKEKRKETTRDVGVSEIKISDRLFQPPGGGKSFVLPRLLKIRPNLRKWKLFHTTL